MPKVSIIVPCYNYGHFLPETIDSVLAQTFSDYEVIIVDDGSNDGTTPAVIAQQAKRDKRIKVITHPKNKGLSTTRNTGVKDAKSEYVLLLDADDILDKTYFEKAIPLAKKENADLLYCHSYLFQEADRIVYYKKPKAVKKHLPFGGALPQSSLYKKSCWQEFGGYDENLPSLADWDFWINFAKHDKKLVLLDEVLFHYRIHHGLFRSYQKMRPELIKRVRKNHSDFYTGFGYYFSLNYFRYVIRPALFQLRTRKGRRVFRLLGITFYED